MEKNDSHPSRTTALDDPEDGLEDFQRNNGSFTGLAAKLRKAGEARKQRRTSPRRVPENQPARDFGDRGTDDASEWNPGEGEFLRSPRRAPVRRRRLPTSRVGRGLIAAGLVLAAVGGILLAAAVRDFFRESPLFRIDSASSIRIMGNSVVTRSELLSVFGSDIGRNIFFVPLARRRDELDRLPWVESATVMRILPNQLRVAIQERVPVAFVRQGSSIELVDAEGVLLNMAPAMISARRYSFPVVIGVRARDPQPLRAKRMRLYQQFLAAIDAGGDAASAKISEIDLTDPEDIRALLPAGASEILVHFGDSDFLERYRRYEQHILGWERQYPRLRSVDLRYTSQVVLGMAPEPKVKADSEPHAATHRPARTGTHGAAAHSGTGRHAVPARRKR